MLLLLMISVLFMRQRSNQVNLTYYGHVATEYFTPSRDQSVGPVTQVVRLDGAYLQATFTSIQSASKVLNALYVGPPSLLTKFLVDDNHSPFAIHISSPEAKVQSRSTRLARKCHWII